MKKRFFIFLFLGLWAGQALSQTTWQVAPGPSSVKFEIQHLIFTQVTGSFKTFTGNVITTTEGLSDAVIDATIPVNSIYTGIRERDTDLMSEDFFFAGRYPDIRFKSHASRMTGDHTYKITGELTLRGVTRTIELDATCTDPRRISRDRMRVDVTANGSLNRYDYGLKWNEVVGIDKMLLGENVDITLNIALIH